MTDRKLCVGTGWYAKSEEGYVRNGHGHAFSRSVAFSKIWVDVLFRYTNPCKVVMVNSDSPVPPLRDERIELINLDKNYNGTGSWWRGFTRGLMMGAQYAWQCDCDFMYVEQDCLVIGDGWVEEIYKVAEQHDFQKFIPGGTSFKGRKIPWRLQQSLVFIPHEKIMELVFGITNPSYELDRRYVDEEQMTNCGVEWVTLPFGYGRLRPIDWTDKHIYAQHWTEEELQAVSDKENLNLDLSGYE